jgi:hypothetical protein
MNYKHFEQEMSSERNVSDIRYFPSSGERGNIVPNPLSTRNLAFLKPVDKNRSSHESGFLTNLLTL